jgi:hypothetical protein
MGAVSHGLEGTHGLGCGGNAFVDVVIFACTEGDIRAKICEVAAEGDLSVGNRYRGCLFNIVVEKLFLFSALFCIPFLLLFGLGECVVDVVVQCISICSVSFLHEGGR